MAWTLCNNGQDSSISTATFYKLDSPGIKSQWGRKFPSWPDWPWGPPSIMYSWYSSLHQGRSGWSVVLTTHLLLLPGCKMSGNIIPPLLCAYIGISTQPPTQLVSGVPSHGWSGQGVKLTACLHPVPRLRMSGAVLLLPLYAFMVYLFYPYISQSVSVHTEIIEKIWTQIQSL
jgi:hypothetical protein